MTIAIWPSCRLCRTPSLERCEARRGGEGGAGDRSRREAWVAPATRAAMLEALRSYPLSSRCFAALKKASCASCCSCCCYCCCCCSRRCRWTRLRTSPCDARRWLGACSSRPCSTPAGLAARRRPRWPSRARAGGSGSTGAPSTPTRPCAATRGPPRTPPRTGRAAARGAKAARACCRGRTCRRARARVPRRGRRPPPCAACRSCRRPLRTASKAIRGLAPWVVGTHQPSETSAPTHQAAVVLAAEGAERPRAHEAAGARAVGDPVARVHKPRDHELARALLLRAHRSVGWSVGRSVGRFTGLSGSCAWLVERWLAGLAREAAEGEVAAAARRGGMGPAPVAFPFNLHFRTLADFFRLRAPYCGPIADTTEFRRGPRTARIGGRRAVMFCFRAAR